VCVCVAQVAVIAPGAKGATATRVVDWRNNNKTIDNKDGEPPIYAHAFPVEGREGISLRRIEAIPELTSIIGGELLSYTHMHQRYLYTYAPKYVCMCVCACLCAQIRYTRYTHMHQRYLYAYAPIHIYTYMHLYTYAIDCTYTPIHIYTYTPIHLYTYTHRVYT
jgi:hypothetical protein